MRSYSKLNLSLALLVGLALSLFLGRFFYSIETKVISTEFEKDVITESLSFEREIALNFYAIQSLKNFYDNSKNVDPNEFRQFSLTLLQTHPNIKALSWVPKITHAERSSYDSEQHYFDHPLQVTERNKTQQLISAQKRDVYFPVSYIEPVSGNENALGFDLASNLKRLATLNLAQQTEKVAITPSIQLVQETDIQKSFLAVLPVYTKDKSTEKQIRGYITAVFHIKDLMINALKQTAERDIRLTLIDQTTPIEEILFISHPEIDRNQEMLLGYPLGLIGGRTWHLEATPSRNYISQKRSRNPFIIFLLLLVFISSSIIYIFRLLRQSELTEKAVNDRTVELNKAKKSLERITLLDEMTGIANRRHFDNYLIGEWQRGKREQTPLSLLVIDIDYFKQFNDNYGHLAGDTCLQKVAQTLSETIKRPADLLARYGGEEFVIIAPNTPDGYILAEQCRQKIKEASLPHAHSSVSKYITVSIGFSTLTPSDDSNPDELFNQADQALYKAKSSGRNQSCAF